MGRAMFYIGHDIKSNEVLTSISPMQMVDGMKSDQWALRPFINRLRSLRFIDKAAYNHQKVKLPYFCFSEFQHNRRLGANFIETQYLVLDFDNIPPSNIDQVFNTMCADKQVFILFITPSGEGIKVVFRLNEALKDKKVYHDLGKSYGSTFAKRYGLLENLDTQTFDVTRANFINPDMNVYCNEDSTPVAWKAITHDSLMASKYFEASKGPEKETIVGEPSSEVYKAILEKLKPNTPKPISHVPVDPAILQVCEKLENALEEFDMAIIAQKVIQYGVQLRAKHADGNMGEVNLYLGKKGYSVVKALKADTHPDLTNILEKLIWQTIHQQMHTPQYEYPGILRRA